MKTQQAVDLLDAFVRWAYNVNLDEFSALYHTDDKAYLLSKHKLMQSNLGAFFGALDTEHRKKLIELITARYALKENKTIVIEDVCG